MLTEDFLQVEHETATKTVREIAAYLQETLGQKVTAYLSGLKDAKVVGKWAKGDIEPRDEREMRLRAAYHAARLVADAYGSATAKAWFFGSNSILGDVAPAAALRNANDLEAMGVVVPAARAFVRPRA